MCYSAQVHAGFARYVRRFGATIDFATYVKLYIDRDGGSKVKIPKAMDAAFVEPQTPEQRQVKALIDAFNQQEATRLEAELFKQRKRLADAERTLQVKTTKAATESRRIATDKIGWTMRKLGDLRRTTPEDRDSRIFPGHYAPVMVWEDGRRVVKAMRYQCRPCGKPALYDVKFPGTYNARRDNLRGFWKEQFGTSHGVMVVSAFYENVSRHAMEGRELADREKEENVVLEFRPNPPQDMLVACLWSHWQAPGAPELLSFAAITDEPPPEIAAAGHDRVIIQIKEDHLDAWLNPQPGNLDALDAILADRERPYYEHRLAA
ncbi:MAG: SOS response-associated peptidase family protein [Luteimonas sp.]